MSLPLLVMRRIKSLRIQLRPMGRSNPDFDYSTLSPQEAFEKFDTNSDGDIDMDEFFHLLEVRLFRKYTKEIVIIDEEVASTLLTTNNSTIAIDYNGLMSAWLLLSDSKREVFDR